jgi:hypothetical protein
MGDQRFFFLYIYEFGCTPSMKLQSQDFDNGADVLMSANGTIL